MDYNNTITPKYNLNGFDVYHYGELTSTADAVKQDFFKQIKNNFIVLADNQINGRGRNEKKWQSVDGNLMMNLVSQETVDIVKNSHISFVIALVLSDVVSELIPENNNVQVKWPNDILVDGVKICGTLIELNDKQLSIGIGMNVKIAPQVVEYATTSLLDLGIDIDKGKVLEMITNRYNEWIKAFNAQGFEMILNMWKNRAKGIGDFITVNQMGNEFIGKFIDVDKNGGLILQTGDGEIVINAGEVWFR